MELDGDGDEADDEEMRMSLLLDLYLYTGACSIDVAVGDARYDGVCMDVLCLCTESTNKTQSLHSLISPRVAQYHKS